MTDPRAASQLRSLTRKAEASEEEEERGRILASVHRSGIPAVTGLRDRPEPDHPGPFPTLFAICKFNAFSTEGFADLPIKLDFEHKPLRGLWILPSYFNHSCLRNAHRTYYGDVMTVFAIADAKKGDEITINYTGPVDSYPGRKASLKLGHGFICDCRLCELDRTDPLYEKREELVQAGLDLQVVAAENPYWVIGKLERQLSEIRATYTTRQELKTQLYSPLKSLGNLHQALGNYTPATKYFIEAMGCLPDSSLTLHGVRAYAQIAECYDRNHIMTLARKYARMAAELHRSRSGASEKQFKKIYADLAHLL